MIHKYKRQSAIDNRRRHRSPAASDAAGSLAVTAQAVSQHGYFNALRLTAVPIPEPASAALLLFGGLFCLRHRR